MRFSLTIDCDNAAFERRPASEIARILLDAARKIREEGAGAFGPEKLRDVNGNTVGSFELTGAGPVYEYEVQGKYAQGWECVTTDETRAGAMQALKEYRENERGTLFRMRRVEVSHD